MKIVKIIIGCVIVLSVIFFLVVRHYDIRKAEKLKVKQEIENYEKCKKSFIRICDSIHGVS